MNLTIATAKTALIASSLTLVLGISAVVAADVLTPTTPPPQPITEKVITDTVLTHSGIITLKVKEMKMSDAIKWVSQLTHAHIDLDKTLADKRISFDFQDRPLAEVLGEIAKLVDGTVQVDKEKADHFSIIPAPKIAALPAVDIAKEPAIDFPPITMRVEAMEIQTVAEFIEKLSGTVIRIDPQLHFQGKQLISLEFQETDFLEALDLLAKLLSAKVQTVANKPNEFEIVPNHPINEQEPTVPAAAQ